LKHEHGLDLPRRAQIEFSRAVQEHTDTAGGEISGADLWRVFTDEYLPAPQEGGPQRWGRYRITSLSTATSEEGGETTLEVGLDVDGVAHHRTG
ncbi:2-isopropylmalate synthase, partial [Shigella sonnei]|nr:2-isopropylmalate synthase [Shigella sonnei]